MGTELRGFQIKELGIFLLIFIHEISPLSTENILISSQMLQHDSRLRISRTVVAKKIKIKANKMVRKNTIKFESD